MLDTLQAQTEPTSLAALSLSTGLHSNTIREHLDALIEADLVERRPQAASGRGRPAWLYSATDASPSNEYAALASALASALHASSQTPVEDAAKAGHTWGTDLGRARGAEPAPNATAARREVVEILADLGFDPQADDRAMRAKLTRCPLLEAARTHPDIVCAVHLGIVRGALDVRGADPEGARLIPFAEPGACVLHLATRPAPEATP